MSEKIKILVVDDNVDFCENVKDVLELKGYKVETANDGFKALEIVKQNGIELVLMDIKMPVMNGVETYKQMKKLIPNTPVVMVTAFAVEELIKESLQTGAFACFRKPLNFDKLFDIIEGAIQTGSMILVVDDDENLCANMEDILKQKNYRVRTAFDSHAAIQLVKDNNFDVMLLDLKLPPLNGLETYLSIKKLKPKLVVIIITGFYEEMKGMVNEMMLYNAYTCIEKPIKMENLISVLEKIEEQKKTDSLKKPD